MYIGYQKLRSGYIPTLQEITSYIAFLSLLFDFTTQLAYYPQDPNCKSNLTVSSSISSIHHSFSSPRFCIPVLLPDFLLQNNRFNYLSPQRPFYSFLISQSFLQNFVFISEFFYTGNEKISLTPRP